MADFLRTVLIQNRSEPADRTFTEDLPVNPLSHIIITIRALNNLLDVTRPLTDLYAMVPDLAVRLRGADLIRGPLQDLAIINARVAGAPPYGQLRQDADNETVSLTTIISFSRRLYWTEEALPAVRRGDLELEMTVDAAVGNFDGLQLQVETVELLDAQPQRHLKYVRNTHTFATTGEERVDLPIGNPLVGVLLRGTTVPTGINQTATWERLRLKVDNVEARYARANWDSLVGELLRGGNMNLARLEDHAHRFNGAAAAFDTTLEPIRGTELAELYGYLDFDPLGDSSLLLETAGRADVQIQRDAGTADLGSFYPIELVQVAGGGA